MICGKNINAGMDFYSAPANYVWVSRWKGVPLLSCGEGRRAAPTGTALTQQEEGTLRALPDGFELVLKLLDFLVLVFIGRVF